MLCPKCSTQLPEGAIFCPKCGARIETELHCPQCGSVIASDSAFCHKCGASLAQAAPEPPAPPVHSAPVPPPVNRAPVPPVHSTPAASKPETPPRPKIFSWRRLPYIFIAAMLFLFVRDFLWPKLTGEDDAPSGAGQAIVDIAKPSFAAAPAPLPSAPSSSKPGASDSSSSDSTDSSAFTPVTGPEASAGDLESDYQVQILGSRVAPDGEGDPALVVKYRFTNNSGKDVKFYNAILDWAYQNDQELMLMYLPLEDADLARNDGKDVASGDSIELERPYKLLDTESAVTIRLTSVGMPTLEMTIELPK